ncbi:hypothetical protein VTL71DRAFT_14818 [Oculimacula yallundae]|uniref:Zn(2)-C6 fungal-type domain-containing protein n=1 Tax=Oculimacula yallundae TaxID=86028 RepID=A0ABR4CJQ3_9HELO
MVDSDNKAQAGAMQRSSTTQLSEHDEVSEVPQGQAKKVFSRAYKACVRCRQSKAKCELPPGVPVGVPSREPGPCVKCMRERRQCEFTATRSHKRQKTSEQAQPENGPGASGDSPDATNSRSMTAGLTGSTTLDKTSSNGAEARTDNTGVRSNSISDEATTQNHHTQRAASRPPMNAARSPSSATQTHRRDGSLDGNATRPNDMSEKLMRTVVTSSNDALGLLFQAVEQQNHGGDNGGRIDGDTGGDMTEISQHRTPQSVASMATGTLQQESLSVAEPEVLNLWGRCRFVRMGWFSAREAITFVDLFFKNCSPLTPILDDFYADHKNHVALVTEEPLLCCTILTISSRMHILPGRGGETRAHVIHDRLWHHSEHLISRIMFGQEKMSSARTRTPGTIESFLLMTEWNPRALHFPPPADGWDFDLLAGPKPSDLPEDTSEDDDNSALYRWREEVVEPAKRSDRMSWMLVGAAMSLAHELGIFNDDDQPSGTRNSKARKLRVRVLLYVYVSQVASRIGCTTLLTEHVSQSVLIRSSVPDMTENDQCWHAFMTCWIGITKLMETINDMIFPSPAVTKQLLLSGRYKSLLRHFQPILEQHCKEMDALERISGPFRDILFIDYQYIRLCINSLAIQAVVERTQLQSTEVNVLQVNNMSPSDYALNLEVIDASCLILRKTISLGHSGQLRFAPVRLYLRIITASIFLLKAMSLGAGNTEIEASLKVLDECIQALKTTAIDSMHLSTSYGTLIERHVTRFRRNFIVPFRPGQIHANSRLMPAANTQLPADKRAATNTLPDTAGSDWEGTGWPQHHGINFDNLQGFGVTDSDDSNQFLQEWMAQPFDPSIAPFGMDGQHMGFELQSLDFLWNLPS